jgi:16S rRNA (adenine1518-N6/adenine1519-N6)-dimethyltransferase
MTFLKAKKSLGQNFLNSKKVAQTMVETAHIGSDDTVLEVGPGTGVLTSMLLATGASVIAVEKDDRAIPLLQTTFAKEISTGRLTIIHDDILSVDAAQLGLRAGSYKIVANIPYYITGQFLRQFLESATPPSSLTLMVQREVAKRIVAKDMQGRADKESILSISVKIYGQPHYIQTVPREYFSPVPNVDSAVVHIENISKKAFSEFDEKTFFSLIKKAFSHKRKVLFSNLGLDEAERAVLSKIEGVGEKTRAEDLSVSTWIAIVKAICCYRGR